MANADIGGQCDFCSAPEIVMAYPCRDFLLDPDMPGIPGQGSSGGWGACRACHELIARGDRERLAIRSARRMARKHAVPYKLALRAVRESQDGFWAHREGAPVPAGRFGPDPTAESVGAAYKIGPDDAAVTAAVQEPVRAVLAIKSSDEGRGHEHAVYYLGVGDEHVRKAELGTHEGRLVQLGESESLGATWDDVRLAVMTGAL